MIGVRSLFVAIVDRMVGVRSLIGLFVAIVDRMAGVRLLIVVVLLCFVRSPMRIT